VSETRKLAAILVADVVGYSRLAGADEDRTLARLRGLRSDLIDPAIAAHHGRVVKRTGDGSIIEFRSVVDAVRCAIEVQNGLIERNAGVPEDRRIEFRVGIHVGDVVEESDGDLMGDGVNIAARLEGVAKPGAICLSEDAYRQVKSRLDLRVSDLGLTALKNIADPMRVYSVEVGGAAQSRPVDAVKSATARKPMGFGRMGVGLAALLVLIAAGAAWRLAGGAQTATPVTSLTTAPATNPTAALSIVVLPFANLSNDPAQDYFADGITWSLTNDLSRIDGLFVIARNTAYAWKGKAVDARQIGKELGVRYILEGSVQRDQSRVRVTVQLTDSETGRELWGDTFEKPIADVFDLQDEIVAQLANALRAKLVADVAARAERKPNADSTDALFQGIDWYNKGYSPETLAKARDYFQRALDADPNNLTALGYVAAVDLTIATNFQGADRAAKFASVEAAATKVLSLRPDYAPAHWLLGALETHTNRGGEGIAEYERALALDPNLAAVHAELGLAMIINGRAGDAEAHVKEALRLSPRDPVAFLWVNYEAIAKLYSGADEEAAALFRRSIELYRNYPISHLYLAAALQLLGRSEEARKEVETALQLNPKFTIRLFRAGASSDNPVYLKQRERIIEAWRPAGIPEG
jgi:TolB-like protein/class 3 adenylate cyclase/Tfp pilus assembly protein PilF